VLPFANIGADPEQEYFADGVTESLTTDLSRIRDSFVIARNTAFTYKGKPADVKHVGRDLNVRYVLEGSVQRGGNRLRVNVQLVSAETGSHVWAERFDKPLADLFDMQDEIVARLARALNTQLIAAEARRTERSPHPDSMDLYFQGMACSNSGLTPEHMAKARHFFERALALDPGNLEALVGVALVDTMFGGSFFTPDRNARLAAAEAALNKVLSLAPEHALAHMYSGMVKMWTNRAADGIAECERALALDRNQANAHVSIGLAKIFVGRGGETEAHIQEAFRLSPRDTIAYLWMFMAGNGHIYVGRYEEAASWMRRAIETNRNFPLSHFYLAAALAQLGKLDEAKAAAAAGFAFDPRFSLRGFRAGASSDNPTYLAQREHIIEAFRKVGVPEG
jgi:TolB-like protein/Tfp pilus assembly protein PilF